MCLDLGNFSQIMIKLICWERLNHIADNVRGRIFPDLQAVLENVWFWTILLKHESFVSVNNVPRLPQPKGWLNLVDFMIFFIAFIWKIYNCILCNSTFLFLVNSVMKSFKILRPWICDFINRQKGIIKKSKEDSGVSWRLRTWTRSRESRERAFKKEGWGQGT